MRSRSRPIPTSDWPFRQTRRDRRIRVGRRSNSTGRYPWSNSRIVPGGSLGCSWGGLPALYAQQGLVGGNCATRMRTSDVERGGFSTPHAPTVAEVCGGSECVPLSSPERVGWQAFPTIERSPVSEGSRRRRVAPKRRSRRADDLARGPGLRSRIRVPYVGDPAKVERLNLRMIRSSQRARQKDPNLIRRCDAPKRFCHFDTPSMRHAILGASRDVNRNRDRNPTQFPDNFSKHEFTRILSVGTRSEPQKTRPLSQRARRCTPNGSRVVRSPTTDGPARPSRIGCSEGTAKAASSGRLQRFADPSRTHAVRPLSSFSRRASSRQGRRPEPF